MASKNAHTMTCSSETVNNTTTNKTSIENNTAHAIATTRTKTTNTDTNICTHVKTPTSNTGAIVMSNDYKTKLTSLINRTHTLRKGNAKNGTTLQFLDGSEFVYNGENIAEFIAEHQMVKIGKVGSNDTYWDKYRFDSLEAFEDAVEQLKTKIFEGEEYLTLDEGVVLKRLIVSINLFPDSTIVIAGWNWSQAFLRLDVSELEWEQQVELMNDLYQSLDDKQSFFFLEGIGCLKYSYYGGIHLTKKGVFIKNKHRDQVLWIPCEEANVSEVAETIKAAFSEGLKGKAAA